MGKVKTVRGAGCGVRGAGAATGFDAVLPGCLLITGELLFHCPTSSLSSDNGVATVPSGPGLGIEIDPQYVSIHKFVTV